MPDDLPWLNLEGKNMKFDTTSIIQVARYSYKKQIHVENHCHNFHHLIYITEGEGFLKIDGKHFHPLKNDFYVIQPGIYHEILSDDIHPLNTLEVKFLSKDSELMDCLGKLPLQFNNDNIGIQAMLEQVVEEALNKKVFHKEIITLHFLELLLCIIRENMSHQMGNVVNNIDPIISEDNYSNELVNKILKYIHRHYTEQLTLTELASEFNINSAYLCRIFSKKYNVSPMQYVNNLKMQKVKKLLASTERSITEISELVGFSSIHYLSRYFASKEKMTPQEYRKSAKNAVHILIEEKYEIVDFKIDLSG